MSSRVEKFNAKLAKMSNDEKAIIEDKINMNKSQEEEVANTSKLKEQGNIQEAAMVVSYEGMQAFSKMFGNSMEDAVTRVLNERMDEITKSMESRLEQVVETQFRHVLNGVQQGIQNFSEGIQAEQSKAISDIVEKVMPTIKKSPEVVKPDSNSQESLKLPKEAKPLLQEVDEETRKKMVEKKAQEHRSFEDWVEKEVPKDEPLEEFKNDTLAVKLKEKLPEGMFEIKKVGMAEEDLDILHPAVVNFMKSKKESVRLVEVTKYLADYEGLSVANPTVLMAKLMKRDYNIQKSGFGQYDYEEKTFNPVN